MSFELHLNAFLKEEFLDQAASVSNVPDFFKSALKLAQLSSGPNRLKIISDMAEILGCNTDELMFLFESLPINEHEAQMIVPDFRQTILLEAAQ